MRIYRLMLAALFLLAPLSAVALRAAPAAAAGECAAGEQYFPETKKCVIAVFYRYWLSHGGLTQQGLPISDDFNEISATDGRTYKVQYFERARFELHPENAGTEYEVLLGLLGNEQLQGKYANPPIGLTDNPLGADCATFLELGKQVCGVFLQYWREHGGLAQQGLPKTGLFLETNPTDGKPYPTQYFERARFEYHAENAGTDYAVLLGLLGREQYLAKYPDSTPVTQHSLADPSLVPLTVADTATEQVGYAKGGYRIALKQPERDYDVLIGATNSSPAAAVNALGLRDQRVEVAFTHLAGGPESSVAIYCRAADLQHFYSLAIGPNDGYYAISRVEGNETRVIAGGGDNRSAVAKVGSAPTRLRADCVGDTLTLYVNGQKLVEARDTTYRGEQGGFGAASDKASGTEVVFTNYKLAILPR